jgi:VanZ family protein
MGVAHRSGLASPIEWIIVDRRKSIRWSSTLRHVKDLERRPTTRLNLRAVAAWLPVVAWAGLIFAFSAQSSLTFIPDQPLDVGKLGHMVIFGVLALLLWRALALTTTLRRPWVLALALAALYAITDELHQSVVPGRDPSLRDVGIDAAGALIAVAILGVVSVRRPRLRLRP